MSSHHHHHQERPYVEECHHHHQERPYVEECDPHHHHQQRPYVEEQYCSESMYAPQPDCGYERVNGSFYEGSPGIRHQNGGSYQRNERLGELGSVAAGAFTLYEANKAKHNRATEAGGLGSAGFGYHEHSEKDKFEDRRW